MEDDAVAELAPARPHDLLHVREPEGDEEQARLVDVPVVAIDDVDLGLVRVEAAAQPVGGHRAAGAAAEDDDLLPAHDAPPASTSARPGRSGCSNRLVELDPGLDRAAERARARDRARRSSCASLRSPPSSTATSNLRGVEWWS